jgi:uncharacterized cupin superfamily protein
MLQKSILHTVRQTKPRGLSIFSVNLTRLAPGAWSMAPHKYKRQDEFIDVLEGAPCWSQMQGRHSFRRACARAFQQVTPHIIWRTEAPATW